jgi:hypothetical protein
MAQRKIPHPLDKKLCISHCSNPVTGCINPSKLSRLNPNDDGGKCIRLKNPRQRLDAFLVTQVNTTQAEVLVGRETLLEASVSGMFYSLHLCVLVHVQLLTTNYFQI